MPKPETKSNTKPSNAKPTKVDAQATLRKVQAKDPGLKRLLEKAYGYAVFPAVGKANLVVGGSLGRGEVFEKGKKVGYATITQLTIGVQIGGDTFDEVVVFESREAFERFKRGKTAFAANASAVLVKAGAASAKNFDQGAAVYVYPHGGMMLELGIGGQRFKFKPADEQQDRGGQKGGQKGGQQSGKSLGKGKGAQGRGQEDEGEEEGQDEGEEGDEEASSSGGGNRALELAGRAVGGVRSAAAKATEMVKRHPVAATVAGVGVVAGLGLLIARAVSGSGAEEGEDDQDSGAEEEEQDEGAQDSAEGSDEDQSDEDEDADRDDEDEDTDARAEDEGQEEDEGEDEGSEEHESENRGVLSRLLSRGKSRA